MVARITLALTLTIAAIVAATGSIESSFAQSNPNLDCSPYRGTSTC
jgi:hypothetical protein